MYCKTEPRFWHNMPTSVLSLPSELISIVIEFISHEDQVNFSVVSKSARLHVLAPLFYDLLLGKWRGQNIREEYDTLEGAGQELKYAIKQVVPDSDHRVPNLTKTFTNRQVTIKGGLYSPNLGVEKCFRLLEKLPNLSELHLDEYHAPVRLPDIALLVRVTEHTLLRHLSFTVKRGSIATGLPITGPGHLSSLCIQWRVHDRPGKSGESLAQLYEFIRPSLTTLTHLEITDFDPFWKPTDLQHLEFRDWPVCPSIRNFQYRTFSQDIKLLGLSDIFPNLTHLGMIFDGYDWNDWAVWTVSVSDIHFDRC
jgi:hypothetical protein